MASGLVAAEGEVKLDGLQPGFIKAFTAAASGGATRLADLHI